MERDMLKKFPPFLRLDSNNKIEYSWEIEPEMQEFILESLANGKLNTAEKLSVEKGILQIYSLPDNPKKLVVYDEDNSQIFPAESLSHISSPQDTIDIITEWVRQAVKFERFDLVRVHKPLKRFNFEYSMGLDIEGVIRTAYREVSESALGWLLKNEQIDLVENFTPDTYRFNEDPHLYQTGFRSILRVPIIFNDGMIGAILLGRMESEYFQLEDAFLLERLAESAAQAFFLSGIQQEQEYNTLAASTLLQTIAGMDAFRDNAEFLKNYCQTLCQLAKTDRVGLFLIDEKDGKYCCIADAGKKLISDGQWVPLHRRPFVEMLRLRSIVAFNLADPRYDPIDELLGQGFTAVLYAPITDAHGNIRACLGTATDDESAMSKGIAGLFKVASEQLGYILNHSILDIEDKEKVREESAQDPIKPPGFEEIIGSSNAIRDTIEKASAVAQYEFPILLYGETGTGKELFAKAIHRSSTAAKGPFIVVNSAAIPDNLLESELFGYKEGTFTGGMKGGKKGKVLLAQGGSLFLDEIGELSLDLQAKLLRMIQEKEVEPLGAEKPVPINVRIISATHRNLKEMVKNQEFREDLYYRLNSIEIKIPPLRERGKDIIELAESMLTELARRSGKRLKRLSAEARQALLNYDCPGNVRELQNIMNRAFVFADGDVIKMEDLPIEVQNIKRQNSGKSEESETQELARLLEEFGGNKTDLAKHLGMTRTGLWKKLKRLGLQ